MATNIIQQLLNILQEINVEAIRVDAYGGADRPLLTSIFLANGMVPDGSPADLPVDIDVSSYLVACEFPGGATAFLTRAQYEAIMEDCDMGKDGLGNGKPVLLGSCTNKATKVCTQNVAEDKCDVLTSNWVGKSPCPKTVEI